MREYVTDKTNNAQTLEYDVVIIGAGAAGLYSALNLNTSLKCAVLNKFGTKESNSVYAQGGIASVRLELDSTKSHVKDTLNAGADLCNEEAVKILVSEGIDDIKKLIEIGVPFDKENDVLCVSREGAHSFNRIIHCGGDATGFHVTKTLLSTAQTKDNIDILDNYMLCDIILYENGNAAGVTVTDSLHNFVFIKAANVVIASGGIGQLYRNTTNSSCSTGDGIAAAIRAGAHTENMEFVQFHPTALIHPDLNLRFFLISEALRGEGAKLLNRKGERFMVAEHPLAELAPRDIVSRSIIAEMKKNDLPNVYLDITFKGRVYLENRFPQIYEECMKRGIDIAVNWIPVIPVQHYFMGGIKTDLNGKTNIKGLYACGESASSGVHGANRLASNSLLECLVFGRRCAEEINGNTLKAINKSVMPNNTKSADIYDYETFRSMIKNTMTKKVGIIRKTEELKQAEKEISVFYENLSKCKLNTGREIETLNMATVSLEIIRASLKRTKSIGAHYRED